MGLYRDSGQENGNYYSILGLYIDNEKKMETAGYLWACGLGSEVKIEICGYCGSQAAIPPECKSLRTDGDPYCVQLLRPAWTPKVRNVWVLSDHLAYFGGLRLSLQDVATDLEPLMGCREVSPEFPLEPWRF